MSKIIPIAIGLLIVIVSIISYPTFTDSAEVQHVDEVKEIITIEDVKNRIDQLSIEYGVSREIMNTEVNCESEYVIDIQSKHINKYGEREESYGLVQIHLPSHPYVSYEQAIDPEFALNFLAEKLQAGKGYLWTCYRKYYMI